MLNLCLNIIESILLTWFVSSLLDIKQKKYLYQFLLIVTNSLLIEISNIYQPYDLILTTIVIANITFISHFFVYNSISQIIFVGCLESVTYCFSSCLCLLVLEYVSPDIFIKIIYLLLSFIIIRLFKKVVNEFDDQLFYLLSSMLFVIHFLMSLFVQIYFILSYTLDELLIAAILLIVTAGLFLIIIMKISQLYNTSLEYQKLKQEKENSKILQSLYNEIKITKHDLKHDYQLLSYYIKQEDYQQLHEFLNMKQNDMSDIPILIQSPCELLNTILNNKMIEAYSRKIQILTEISVNKEIGIEDYDLCEILGNMLDNAIENSSENDQIHITIKQDDFFLHIVVSNPIKDVVDFQTKKDKNHHGFGLVSIKRICHKYKSDLFIKQENQTLIISTSLQYQ